MLGHVAQMRRKLRTTFQSLLEGGDSSRDQRTVERIVEDFIMQAYIDEIGRESVGWNQTVKDWDQWWDILNTA
jgi:hypothetical protein